MCQLPPPEMPQVPPRPHSHCATGNFSQALLLPCVCRFARHWEGAAGTAHLALLSHSTQPPHLLLGSYRSEVTWGTLQVRTRSLASPSPRCSWKRGCTWANIWAGRGGRGLGWAERGTWTPRERHKEEGGVGIMSGHPKVLPLPPWSLPPCQRGSRQASVFQEPLSEQPEGTGMWPRSGERVARAVTLHREQKLVWGGGAALRRTPVPPFAAGLHSLPTASSPPPPTPSPTPPPPEKSKRQYSFSPSGPSPPLLVIVMNANNTQ